MVGTISRINGFGNNANRNAANTHVAAATQYRFEIFKGKMGDDGRVIRARSVGSAYLKDGMRTYMVVLKTFLDDRFYLLPNNKAENQADFVILTRETAQNLKRKFFWNSIGEGTVLDGVNAGIVKLSWDVLADDLYMSLHPVKTSEVPDTREADAA